MWKFQANNLLLVSRSMTESLYGVTANGSRLQFIEIAKSRPERIQTGSLDSDVLKNKILINTLLSFLLWKVKKREIKFSTKSTNQIGVLTTFFFFRFLKEY